MFIVVVKGVRVVKVVKVKCFVVLVVKVVKVVKVKCNVVLGVKELCS